MTKARAKIKTPKKTAKKSSAGTAGKRAAPAKKPVAKKPVAKKPAAKKPAARKPAAKAPPQSEQALRFSNPRVPRSADELSERQKQQIEHAGKLYDGNKLSAAERLSPDREHGDGEDEGSFHGMLEIWDVEVDGEHRYDAYLYMADSGTVFRKGTLEVVSERIQTYFEATDEAFAKGLRAMYHEAAKAHHEGLRGGDRGGAWSAYREALDEVE